uniref:phosphoserine transaminase n=1 Tax=Cajanus cajan TaxID=3821 RepID=A0A151TLR1_CAJCA|nr:hypothetical protein KK1_021611 [Cajanus cajan]
MSISTSPQAQLLPQSQKRFLPNPRTHTAHLSLPFRPIPIKCASTPAQLHTPQAPTQAHSQERLFNFAAGPATLPESVLRRAQSELFIWRGSGMSVMEMSHRGKDFKSIIEKAESDLRSLLQIPPEYSVLFLQGGATTQFAALPLNLCRSPHDPVDYIVTGSWSDKAFKEAQKYSKPNPIWYLHICANETIHGVEYKTYPTPLNPNAVLVADMSSNFCSKPVDVSKFGVIYAGAQKNVGPSGVTIVIIRNDLIAQAQDVTPVMLEYRIHAENHSLYNTPPCYGIYMCGLVFEDLLEQGGLVEEAAKENMVQLKGHRSVGGMRASIYNAMPLAGVQKLVSFMKDFQAKHA